MISLILHLAIHMVHFPFLYSILYFSCLVTICNGLRPLNSIQFLLFIPRRSLSISNQIYSTFYIVYLMVAHNDHRLFTFHFQFPTFKSPIPASHLSLFISNSYLARFTFHFDSSLCIWKMGSKWTRSIVKSVHAPFRIFLIVHAFSTRLQCPRALQTSRFL